MFGKDRWSHRVIQVARNWVVEKVNYKNHILRILGDSNSCMRAIIEHKSHANSYTLNTIWQGCNGEQMSKQASVMMRLYAQKKDTTIGLVN